MKRNSRILATVILAFLAPSVSLSAVAGGVVECNRCPSTANAAISKGNGLTVVVDFESAQLTAYEVEYDRELKRWRTMRTAIPEPISAAFYRVLDAASLAASSAQSDAAAIPGHEPTQGEAADSARSNKNQGGLVVTVHPDNPQYSNPARFTFPSAYKDFRASTSFFQPHQEPDSGSIWLKASRGLAQVAPRGTRWLSPYRSSRFPGRTNMALVQ